jgi:hypothetical protein
MTKIRVEVDDEQFENDSVTAASVTSGLSEDEASKTADENPAKKVKRGFKPEALASAFQTVLRQSLPKAETALGEVEAAVPAATGPILLRRKAVERNIEEEQIDRKARLILKAQIRANQEAIHIKDATRHEGLNYERSLRKLATRGVVQLFNAIRTSQQHKVEEDAKVKAKKAREARLAIPRIPSAALVSDSSSTTPAISYLDFLKQKSSK